MSAKTIHTDQFGIMTLDKAGLFYEAPVDSPHLASKNVAIEAIDVDVGARRVHAFLKWLEENHERFKLALEEEIQNCDLVWDGVWDSILGEEWVEADAGFFGNHLNLEDMNYYEGRVHVWINTSGLHSDHLVKVTMTDDLNIESCEI